MQDIEFISQSIVSRLPYLKNFLFVDRITSVDGIEIIGQYTFKNDAFFYHSHFKHIPVTPGVILIEMMGQIGLVSHLVYLNKLHLSEQKFHPILYNVESSFLKQVYINDLLTVKAEKIYLRNGYLKSNMTLFDSQNDICAHASAQLKLFYD